MFGSFETYPAGFTIYEAWVFNAAEVATLRHC
jgi:hypothetical protein